jgi:hypothetical protein
MLAECEESSQSIECAIGTQETVDCARLWRLYVWQHSGCAALGNGCQLTGHSTFVHNNQYETIQVMEEMMNNGQGGCAKADGDSKNEHKSEQ